MTNQKCDGYLDEIQGRPDRFSTERLEDGAGFS